MFYNLCIISYKTVLETCFWWLYVTFTLTKYANFWFKHFWISAVLHFVSQWACLGENKLWHFLPFGDFRDFSWWVTQTCIFQFPSLSDMSWGLTGFNSYWKLLKRCQKNSYFFSKKYPRGEGHRLENCLLKFKKHF